MKHGMDAFRPHSLQEPSVGAGIDGGGSVRVPAALCGVAALRPTVGRTATAHCPPNAFSIMAFGVISGCLEDALLVYAAIGNAGMRPVCLTFRCVYFRSMYSVCTECTEYCHRHYRHRVSAEDERCLLQGRCRRTHH